MTYERTPEIRKKLSESLRRTAAAQRAAKAEQNLHANEEAELRTRARKNVENDLTLLRDLALRRVALSNKRIKFLGECELELIDVLVARLGKVPQP